MKRLFNIRGPRGLVECAPGIPLSFDNKMAAKRSRNNLNKEYGAEQFHVVNGPDHIGSHGQRHVGAHQKNKRRGAQS